MFLQQSYRVARIGWPEQAYAQAGLFPSAGVAEEPDFLRGQDLTHSQGDRHRWCELVRGSEVALGEGKLDPMTAVMTGVLGLSDMGVAMGLQGKMQALFSKLR